MPCFTGIYHIPAYIQFKEKKKEKRRYERGEGIREKDEGRKK